MGYMGLSLVTDSDMASDLFHVCQREFVIKLNKGLKKRSNHINTCGIINVALIIESGVLDKFDSYVIFDYLDKDGLIKGLREKIIEAQDKTQWDSEKNRLFHLKNYKRMAKNVNKFLAEQR